VLVVEDERKLAQVLASALQTEHYEVVVSPTGEDGFFRANAEVFDLIVLDLMLPGRGGLEILHTLRQRHVQTAVLILTARDGIEDRVLGLDLGADDYLVKPFALPEPLARIRALLRRGRPAEAFRLKVADLELEPPEKFELLEYLPALPGVMAYGMAGDEGRGERSAAVNTRNPNTSPRCRGCPDGGR